MKVTAELVSRWVKGMPEDLVAKCEEARLSDERAGLDRRMIRSWARAWVTKNVTKEQRAAAKIVNFGIIYGKQEPSLIKDFIAAARLIRTLSGDANQSTPASTSMVIIRVKAFPPCAHSVTGGFPRAFLRTSLMSMTRILPTFSFLARSAARRRLALHEGQAETRISAPSSRAVRTRL